MNDVKLTARDIKMLRNAVPHILDDEEWVGCPGVETRVELYTGSVYRLGRWLKKHETIEAKIALARPLLLRLVRQEQMDRIHDRLEALEAMVGVGEL